MTDERNKEKFTPGPWEIRRHEFVNFVSQGIYSDKSTTGIIADMPYRTKFLLAEYREKFSQEEVDANAALIAAAPEMYELLDDICRNYQCMPNPVEVEKRIEAVLAKARGETE